MAEWVEYLNSAGDSTVVQKRWRQRPQGPLGRQVSGAWATRSWGCGGNMRPEYYADEFRRYQTYCRNYGDNKLCRIACGPNVDDYNWTAVLMERAGRVHGRAYPALLHRPRHLAATRGAPTEFDQADYDRTLRKWRCGWTSWSPAIEQIMNRYDPKRRVGLIVDEWGTWFDVEPGTNPGFLYQQNTMRDAQVAALTLNIFNAHADRMVMANLAQTVNVLAVRYPHRRVTRWCSPPTYHVFRPVQGASGGRCWYPVHVDADDSAQGVKPRKRVGLAARAMC